MQRQRRKVVPTLPKSLSDRIIPEKWQRTSTSVSIKKYKPVFQLKCAVFSKRARRRMQRQRRKVVPTLPKSLSHRIIPEKWQRTSTGVLFQLFDETLEDSSSNDYFLL